MTARGHTVNGIERIDVQETPLSGSWYARRMKFALEAAKRSPDPSTQNGAIFLGRDGHSVTACNEFPRDVNYDPERWERPTKYSFIEHAERNAIYEMARRGYITSDGIMVAAWAACADCARAIIQSGALVLVRLAPKDTNERWDDSILRGDQMMKEAQLRIIELENTDYGITLRRNGEEVTF